jgi:hypothetical protein
MRFAFKVSRPPLPVKFAVVLLLTEIFPPIVMPFELADAAAQLKVKSPKVIGPLKVKFVALTPIVDEPPVNEKAELETTALPMSTVPPVTDNELMVSV